MTNNSKSDFVVPILLNTLLLNVFIFSRIFYGNFNFLTSTIVLSCYALPLALVIFFICKNFLIKIHSTGNDSKAPLKPLLIITALNIWLSTTGVMGYLNQKLDSSEMVVVSLGVEAVEQISTKRGIYHVAIVNLPFDTGALGIPDAPVEINISKSEQKLFNLGTSKVEIKYKSGFFQIPWQVEKTFIP